ncbi:cytochrome c oxidase assembly protein [Planobispora rosea]|uniref:cytochrome c oxidase assembly protein n=1 Tax=Planobispora rosea TaxID=35762 RepID=UPI00083B7894|nr:cytochrome c oxidase assembly protein [Planobispora rosea]
MSASHAHSGPDALAAFAPLLAAAAYLLLVARRRALGRSWSPWRSSAFLTGCALLSLALGHVLPFGEGDFRGHMLQHLLIGMLAPLALVLAAPFTLVLGVLPPHRGRRLTRLLRSRTARLIAHPVTALLLTLGGLVVLYCTPLYGLTTATPWAHHLVHAHFLASGYLFAWVIAGPDPAPHRPSVPSRLVVLGVAVAGHAVLSQLMYAGIVFIPGVPDAQRRGGAELMYYGGDIAELLLALALLVTWRPAPGRSPHGAPGEPAAGPRLTRRWRRRAGSAPGWPAAAGRRPGRG